MFTYKEISTTEYIAKYMYYMFVLWELIGEKICFVICETLMGNVEKVL